MRFQHMMRCPVVFAGTRYSPQLPGQDSDSLKSRFVSALVKSTNIQRAITLCWCCALLRCSSIHHLTMYRVNKRHAAGFLISTVVSQEIEQPRLACKEQNVDWKQQQSITHPLSPNSLKLAVLRLPTHWLLTGIDREVDVSADADVCRESACTRLAFCCCFQVQRCLTKWQKKSRGRTTGSRTRINTKNYWK